MRGYLRLIYELALDGCGIMGSQLVEHLGVRHASATNMPKRLKRPGLVWRVPYRSVELTPVGERAAAPAVLRSQRLIKLYLVQAPGYSQEEVCEEAESLELAVSDSCIKRMVRALRYPEADIHKASIPE